MQGSGLTSLWPVGLEASKTMSSRSALLHTEMTCRPRPAITQQVAQLVAVAITEGQKLQGLGPWEIRFWAVSVEGISVLRRFGFHNLGFLVLRNESGG